MSLSSPFYSPDRPAPQFRMRKFYDHFRKLMANKEDTAQVFHMAECLQSRRSVSAARAFCESDHGKRLAEAEPNLPILLDDHDALVALPEGSVAHAYVAFMRREGLSAAGLVEASDLPGRRRYSDKLQWFDDRLRDTHDMAHVLTGYGRDGLGEQCVLGFTDGQHHDWTDWFIAWVGALEYKSHIKVNAPVLRSVRQAAKHGRMSAAIFKQDIRALLAEPLDVARRRMNIAPPTLYETCHARLRARGLDPYNLSGDSPAIVA